MSSLYLRCKGQLKRYNEIHLISSFDHGLNWTVSDSQVQIICWMCSYHKSLHLIISIGLWKRCGMDELKGLATIFTVSAPSSAERWGHFCTEDAKRCPCWTWNRICIKTRHCQHLVDTGRTLAWFGIVQKMRLHKWKQSRGAVVTVIHLQKWCFKRQRSGVVRVFSVCII